MEGSKSSIHRGGLEIPMLPKGHAMQMWSLWVHDTTLTNTKVKIYKLVQYPMLMIPVDCPRTSLTAHLIPFKKFLSFIFALLSPLIAFVNSSLFSTASNAPLTLPFSFTGKSIVCCCSGTFGARASVSPDAKTRASSFRCRFAATRRCFLDFAAVG